MDVLGLVNIPGWIITLIVIVITLYLYSVWKHRLWKQLGVPGPKPVPFFGIMISYMKKGIMETDLELVKKYGDVIGIYHGHLPVLLVSDPDMLKEICIKKFSSFTNRPLPFKVHKRHLYSITIATDNHWKFLRSILSPTFSSGKLKMMEPKIHKCSEALLDNIRLQKENSESVNMKELCGAYTMDVIASTSFGIEVDSQKDPNNKFVHYAKMAALGDIKKPSILLAMMFPFLNRFMTITIVKKEVHEFFTAAVRSTLEVRKSADEKLIYDIATGITFVYNNMKYHDFLQLMLDARHSDKANDESTEGDLQQFKNRGLNVLEIEANSRAFFIAGYDTTANTLAFACYCLATNPDMQNKVIEEIDTVFQGDKPQHESIVKLEYLDRFFNEVLRLYGAAARFNRTCKEDITVKGVFIPKGTDVSIPMCAIHRNPKYWPEPDTFDPERFTAENKAKRPDYTFVPFGIGPRSCIGMRLALLEAKMALVYMLQNFTFAPSERTEIPVILEGGGLVRAKNGIHLKIEKRM